MAIWVIKDGQREGPYEEQDVRELIYEGTYADADLAIRDGQYHWSTLGEVLGRTRPAYETAVSVMEPEPGMGEGLLAGERVEEFPESLPTNGAYPVSEHQAPAAAAIVPPVLPVAEPDSAMSADAAPIAEAQPPVPPQPTLDPQPPAEAQPVIEATPPVAAQAPGAPAPNAGPAQKPQPVTPIAIVDFQMPFTSMVMFMVKWALAAVPALLILGTIIGIFWIGIVTLVALVVRH